MKRRGKNTVKLRAISERKQIYQTCEVQTPETQLYSSCLTVKLNKRNSISLPPLHVKHQASTNTVGKMLQGMLQVTDSPGNNAKKRFKGKWENLRASGEERKGLHLMTVVMDPITIQKLAFSLPHNGDRKYYGWNPQYSLNVSRGTVINCLQFSQGLGTY